MEQTALHALILFVANQSPSVMLVIIFALVGSPIAVTIIILVAWIKDGRKTAIMLGAYRKDMDETLKIYGKHVDQLAAYYEKNVELVKSWQAIAEGFQTTVMLNTETMTRVCELVKTNQYCPNVRVDKNAKGPQR